MKVIIEVFTRLREEKTILVGVLKTSIIEHTRLELGLQSW